MTEPRHHHGEHHDHHQPAALVATPAALAPHHGHDAPATSPAGTRPEHGGDPADHDKHAGRSVAMFRDKFGLSLALAILAEDVAILESGGRETLAEYWSHDLPGTSGSPEPSRASDSPFRSSSSVASPPPRTTAETRGRGAGQKRRSRPARGNDGAWTLSTISCSMAVGFGC